MKRKVYKCQFCGGMVETWNQTGGGLSCCGAPLAWFGERGPRAPREEPAPLIDLSEVVVNGKAHWQFLPPREAALASAR